MKTSVMGGGGYHDIDSEADITQTGFGIVYGKISHNSVGTKAAVWGGYERLNMSFDTSTRSDCNGCFFEKTGSGSLDSVFIKGVSFSNGNGWGWGLEARYIDTAEPIYSISFSAGYNF